MCKMRLVVLALVVLVCSIGSMTAQGSGWTSAVVEYFDDAAELTILDAKGKPMDNLYIGLELLAGDTLKTGNTAVELRLAPGGSLIRISPKTSFRIDNLPTPKTEDNAFSLPQGKIRVIAQKSGKATYTFRTPTAVAGVRGTEFGLEVAPGKTEKLVVRTGVVEFTATATRTTVVVAEKQAADTLAPVFKAEDWQVPTVEAFFTDEDIEAEKREAEKFEKIRLALEAERQRKADEAARARETNDAKALADQQARQAEAERVQVEKEEAERQAAIRKAGALAMAAEAERQKERDRMQQEALAAEKMAQDEAARLKVQFMKGFVFLEGGSFYLGDKIGKGKSNEQPARRWSVDSYYLGQNVVSVRDFRRFVEATGYRTTAELKRRANTTEGGMWAERMARSWRFPGYAPHPADPARCLSWYDAVAYCNWLSKEMGKTPAYVYEGHGTEVTDWPSGWNKAPHRMITLVAGANGFRLLDEARWEYAAEGGAAQKVLKDGKSAIGLSRLAFVSEWTQDLYREYDARTVSAEATSRVIRGVVAGSPSARDRQQPDFAADNLLVRVCLPAGQ